jgi:hypothetical protein
MDTVKSEKQRGQIGKRVPTVSRSREHNGDSARLGTSKT